MGVTKWLNYKIHKLPFNKLPSRWAIQIDINGADSAQKGSYFSTTPLELKNSY